MAKVAVLFVLDPAIIPQSRGPVLPVQINLTGIEWSIRACQFYEKCLFDTRVVIKR